MTELTQLELNGTWHAIGCQVTMSTLFESSSGHYTSNPLCWLLEAFVIQFHSLSHLLLHAMITEDLVHALHCHYNGNMRMKKTNAAFPL